MPRTLYLHIGSHKTGTTSIQSNLTVNKASLTDHDFAYVTGDNGVNLHGMFGVTDADKGVWDHLARPHDVVQILTAPKQSNVIASTEGFSYLFDRAAIADVHALLRPHFDAIRIVSYLRRQDQLAVSHHQEGAKQKLTSASRLYGHSPFALPQPSDLQTLYLDYNRRIGLWADVFGEKAMLLRVFDRNLLTDGDVVADFLALLGLNAARLDRIKGKNVSMGFAKTKMGHILNELVPHQQVKAGILARIPNDGKLLPSRGQAMAFLEPYRSGNRALNASVSPPNLKFFPMISTF